MATDAFVLRYELDDPQVFANQFMASGDFSYQALKNVSRNLNLPVSVKKNDQISQISREIFQNKNRYGLEKLIEQLILKNKGWMALRIGQVREFPQLSDATELIVSVGQPEWYGPVKSDLDPLEGSWYIRPVLVEHWEVNENTDQIEHLQIRWLCFALVRDEYIALNWQGFSHSRQKEDVTKRYSQFPYWEQIPIIFREIEDLTGANVRDINLQKIMLHNLWEKYRGDSNYRWIDRRIRAESGGVSLNARAGVFELDTEGIRGLARTVRKAVERDLVSRYGEDFRDQSVLDEVILRTLMREYGTLSYEFSLEDNQNLIIRTHSYFGLRPQLNSPDCLQHMNVYYSKRDELEQLEFLLSQIRGGF